MKFIKLCTLATTAFIACTPAKIKTDHELSIDYTQKGAEVDPKMYGIFFEEINHSGDGALYTELIRNRNFEEHVIPSGTTYKDGFVYAPHKKNYSNGEYSGWKTKWDTDSLKMIAWKVKGNAQYDVVSENPLHINTPNAMKMEMKEPGVILENEGYWGVSVKANEKYDLRFYLNAAQYEGTITAKIVSATGETLAEQVFFISKPAEWMEYTAELTPSKTETKGSFQLIFNTPGKVYVDYVSLFPQNTFKGRKNGMRADVAQLLADLKPGFLRWPGGCIAEGATYENRAKWKETLGDPMLRHSEWILWNYHCTWGFGYHEFLQFCEDIGADAMFVANVGMSCSVRNGDYTDDLEPIIQDICDAIEYATGDVNTTWGAKRAAAGHPEPFNLKYVELGNEQSGDFYAKRYNYLYNILKPKYPNITFICTLQLENSLALLEKADMIDPHWYVNPDYFYDNVNLFDNMDRNKYDVYVGEYAVISAGNMQGALAEAAFITGMERNSDLVKMASYAPLIENSNQRDWPTNLIWVNNETAFGRTSYHVQKMYGHNMPDYNLGTTISRNVPSPFNGCIGLSGDNLNGQYRNLKVTDKDGNVLIDGNDFSGFTAIEKQSGGRFRMPAPTMNMLKSLQLTNGIVEFEALAVEKEIPAFQLGQKPRKITALPALSFGCDESFKNYYTLNLGSAGNKSTLSVTRTINGFSGYDRDQKGPEFNMTPGEWYKFRIEFKGTNDLICYINDEKILEQEVHPLNKIHAVSGYDKESGETIVKFVNGTNEAYTTNITLNCSKVRSKGTVITLSSDIPTDENSYENPNKIVPVTSEYSGFGKDFQYTFAPNSFTIMRIKTSEN